MTNGRVMNRNFKMALGLAIIDGAAANHLSDRPKLANQMPDEFRLKLPLRPELQSARVGRPELVSAQLCTADVVNKNQSYQTYKNIFFFHFCRFLERC